MNTPPNRLQVFQHLCARERERYGLTITRQKLAQIRKEIAADKWMCVAIESNGAKHMVGKVDGVLVRIVFNPGQDVIVTFLPLETGVARPRM